MKGGPGRNARSAHAGARACLPTHERPFAATPCPLPRAVRISGTLLGLETPSCSLLLVVLLVSGGVSLAALGEVEFHLLGFVLVLSSAALAGLRGCMLQRMLQGRNTAELLSWRQSVHPVQLIYALAPWSTATALLIALFMEGEELSALHEHVPQLQALMVRRRRQTHCAASGSASHRRLEARSRQGPRAPWASEERLGRLSPTVPPLEPLRRAAPSADRVAFGRAGAAGRHERSHILHGHDGDVGRRQDERAHAQRRGHAQGGRSSRP